MSVYEKYYINIEEMRPKILEAFVAVYGEKHRQLISERMDNIYINTYITADDLSAEVNRALYGKKGELSISFLEKNGFALTDEQREQLSAGYSSYKLEQEAQDFLKMCFGNNTYIENRYNGLDASFDTERYKGLSDWQREKTDQERVDILNKMGASVTIENYKEVMLSGSIDHILEKIMATRADVKEMDKEYKEFEDGYSEELAEIDRCTEVEQRVKRQKTIEYLQEISQYLPQEEQEEIASSMKQQWINYHSEYLSYSSISIETLIESFSSQAEDVMLNGTEWQKDTIKANRIKFFKLKGIDLGKDYEAYLEDEQTKTVIPAIEFADQIADIRKKHEKQYISEYIEATGSYRDNKKGLDELDLISKDSFCPEFVKKGEICLSTNIVEQEGRRKPKAVLHIPVFKMIPEYKDVVLIHEIGHAIELELIGNREEQVDLKTGFEYITEDLTDDSDYDPNREKRDIEIMSETLHQNLAIEVTEHLHSNGDYLIGNPSIAKTRGGTMYENNNVMLARFYKRYKPNIIDARMSDSGFQELTTLIPYENIQRLNDIVKEYNGLPYYTMMEALFKKETTPETIRREELIQDSIEVTDNIERKGHIMHRDLLNSDAFRDLFEMAIKVTEKYIRRGQVEAVEEKIYEMAKAIEDGDLQIDTEQRGEDE